MTPTSPFLQNLVAQLDTIEAALLAQDTDTLTTACQQLQQLLQSRARQPGKEKWTDEPNRLVAMGIDKRLKVLRQALLQQGAAAERALSTLFPNGSPSAYGNKSAFGAASRGPNTRLYQA